MNLRCGKFNADKNIAHELLSFVAAYSLGTKQPSSSSQEYDTRMMERLHGHMDFVGCKFNPRQDHQEGRAPSPPFFRSFPSFFHGQRSSVLAVLASTDSTVESRKFAKHVLRTPPIIREAPVLPGRTSRCALRH